MRRGKFFCLSLSPFVQASSAALATLAECIGKNVGYMGSWGYLLIFRYDAVKGEVPPKIRNRHPENTVTIKAHHRSPHLPSTSRKPPEIYIQLLEERPRSPLWHCSRRDCPAPSVSSRPGRS